MELPCTGSETCVLTAVNRDPLSLVLPVGTEVSVQTESRGLWFAPVEEGQVVGVVRFFAGGKELASLPLTASHAVALPPRKPGLLEKILDF